MKKLYFLTFLFLATVTYTNSQELVADIRAGNASGIDDDTVDMIAYDGKLLLTAHLGDGKAYELAQYDPVTGIVTNLSDIDPGSDDSHPIYKVVLNGKLYFAADAQEKSNGVLSYNEMYIYDGSSITKQSSSGFSNNSITDNHPKNLTIYNGNIYFSAIKFTNSPEVQLVKWSGVGNYSEQVVNGTYVRGSIENYPDPASFEVANGKLYFSAKVSANTRGLFFYDDVSDNSGQIGGHSNPTYIKANGTDLFYLSNGTYWKYDTNSQTAIATNAPIPSSKPVSHSGKLYYSSLFSNSSINSYDLVVYDIALDTFTRIQTNPTGNSNVSEVEKYGGKIFFSAFKDGAGIELHIYDPISNNFTIFSNIYPGSVSSAPKSLYVFDNKLYFSALVPTLGRELYRINSTNVSPKLKAIIPHKTYTENSTGGSETIDLNNHFEDFEDGSNLTYTATSLNTSIFTPSVSGNNLTINYGDNLGTTTLSITAEDSSGAKVTYSIIVTVEGNTANVENHISDSFKLFPNPAKSYFTLEKTNLEILNIKVFNILGSVVKEYSSAQNKYDISTLSKGIFLLEITTNKGKGLKKLIID